MKVCPSFRRSILLDEARLPAVERSATVRGMHVVSADSSFIASSCDSDPLSKCGLGTIRLYGTNAEGGVHILVHFRTLQFVLGGLFCAIGIAVLAGDSTTVHAIGKVAILWVLFHVVSFCTIASKWYRVRAEVTRLHSFSEESAP